MHAYPIPTIGAPQTLARLQNNHIIPPHTPIKNLWLVGADSLTAGVAPAALSGLATAARILYPVRGISGIAPEVIKMVQTPGKVGSTGMLRLARYSA